MATKFKAVENAIVNKFPGGKVEVTGEATPGASGKFEVQIVGGALLHSKAGGDGYVDSAEKMNKVFLRPLLSVNMK
eukprot:gene17101-20327_t